MIEWQWSKFEGLSTFDLYEIMKCRQEVFAIEQNCVYQDADDLDKTAWHLIAWETDQQGSRSIGGYLRVVYPGRKYDEPSIGRLLTTKQSRGTGLGKKIVEVALSNIEKEYANCQTRISAQVYLHDFYSAFGFESVNEPYDEDGIAHIEMVKP